MDNHRIWSKVVVIILVFFVASLFVMIRSYFLQPKVLISILYVQKYMDNSSLISAAEKVEKQKPQQQFNKFANNPLLNFERPLNRKNSRYLRRKSFKSFSCCLPYQEKCKPNPLPDFVPDRIDWRTTGYVGPVLKQKFNVCWAFSIIGVMETLAANISRKFTRLSIQEVIDLYESHISWGNSIDVVDTICNYHKLPQFAITTEQDYPLSYRNQSIQKSIDKGWWLRYYEVRRNVAHTEMKKYLVNRGPLIAKVNAYPWAFYIEGIIQYHCENNNLHHSVQIEGFVQDEPIPYYIIRNSWGTDFGVKGYVKIAMGDFVCGVGSQIIALNVFNKDDAEE